MTRRDRDKLAELLEGVAADLDAAEGKAESAAAASCSATAEVGGKYAYQVGYLESATQAGARRIRALVAEFLAARAKGRAA